jgi:hypothetical protein
VLAPAWCGGSLGGSLARSGSNLWSGCLLASSQTYVFLLFENVLAFGFLAHEGMCAPYHINVVAGLNVIPGSRPGSPPQAPAQAPARGLPPARQAPTRRRLRAGAPQAPRGSPKAPARRLPPRLPLRAVQGPLA